MTSSATFRTEFQHRVLPEGSMLQTVLGTGAAANETVPATNTRQWLFRLAAGLTAAGIGAAGMAALASTAISPLGGFVALPTAFVALAALGCWIDEKLASPRPA